MFQDKSSQTYVVKIHFSLNKKLEQWIPLYKLEGISKKMKYVNLRFTVAIHIWRETIKHICWRKLA